MEDFDELVNFVGPYHSRTDVRQAALKYLVGAAVEQDLQSPDSLFLREDFRLIKQLLHLINTTSVSAADESKNDLCFTVNLVFSVLCNAASSHSVAAFLLEDSSFLVNGLMPYLHVGSGSFQSAAKLASNLTLGNETATKFSEHIFDKAKFISELLDSLSKDALGENYGGYLLRNMTQLVEVRLYLSSAENGKSTPLTRLYPVLKLSKNASTRLTVADIIRNCAIDSDCLAKVLTQEFLVTLLFPVIGGEELNEDENDQLPLDLQYMDADKAREPSFQVRSRLLDTLYQMCSTAEGRKLLRENGAYYVLREYHLWEEKQEGKDQCERIVQILIQSDEELGLS